MSKWLWILGAGAGAVMLAGAGRDNEPTNDAGHGDEPSGDDETIGDEPPDPSGGGHVDPPPNPWMPSPYDQYERGLYTIDLTGLATGVRWRVYATAAQPPTESAKDAVRLGVGIEVSDEEARVAANAFADELGVLPVEPYPVPPKPMPDPPLGGAGPEDGAPPPGPLPPPMGGLDDGPSVLKV